jgi:hypothetical protein
VVRRDDDARPVVRRSGRRVRVVAGGCAAAIAIALAGLLAGCGEAPNPPIAIVQNYLNALGGGGYANACGMVDRQALAALMHAKHVRTSCATFFRRCLPNHSLKLKSDQTQLLYANINVTLSDNGAVANADTSATPVASELKHVTLKHEHGVWKFTGLGRAIEACRPNAHRHRHEKASGHKH